MKQERKHFSSRLLNFLFLALVGMFLLNSCASKKEILYMQDIEKLADSSEIEHNNPTIVPSDLLIITVSSFDMEAVLPFNLLMPARNMEQQIGANSRNRDMQGYLVSAEGTIEFPVLGTIEVAGLTRSELIKKLKEDISKYVKDPIVNVTISNYKVTVLGEVNRPGTFTIPDERITLLEAIGRAGDLTIYGKRENILILREKDGVKEYKKVDITKTDFLDSDYYYLKQNDVVYVEPNNAQVNAAAYNRNSSVYISIASVLISLILLISRF